MRPESTRPGASRLVQLLIVVIASTLACSSGDDGSADAGAAGAARGLAGQRGDTIIAPDFALESLTGETVRLSDFRGKVVLVDFWATWCGPCRMSIPHLKELYSDFATQGFEILGVAVGDREDHVRRFVQNEGIEYIVGLGSQSVAMDYGITNIPTAFLVDQDGKVAARYMGYQQKRVLESAIRQLL